VNDGADGADVAAGRPGAAGSARLAIIVVLTLAVIVGVRAVPRVRWDPGHGPAHSDGFAIAVALEVVLAALQFLLLRLRKRDPKPGWLAGQLRAWLIVLIPCLMVAVGIALLTLIPDHPHTGLKPQKAKPAPVPKAPLRRLPPRPGVTPDWLVQLITYTILTLLAAAVIVAAVMLARRLRRSAADRPRAPDDAAIVRGAVEAGRSALAGVSDARLAIIACYLAMERSLDQAGAARGPAETADELLARATTAGLLHGAPPARLTELFSAARFSRHDVPDGARAEALRALDQILADLSDVAAVRRAEPASQEVAP
jgi:hypothetical protein